MADLGKWSGGSTSLIPTTLWTSPSGLFGTEDRNDGSAYTWTDASARLTLPSSGLADGYLLIASFEFVDTSNGRCNPQAQWVQNSGTGTFLSGIVGGYNRQTSDDTSYCRVWAFVDNPSASATFDFEWTRDGDIPTGGTVRSEVQVVPLFYSDWAAYSSGSASLYGGTTPTKVTGFTGSDGANITIASDVVTLAGANKRYLCLGSYYRSGTGSIRTQRWGGFEVDGAFADHAKGYAYYRNSSNDEAGQFFTTVIDRATTDIDVELSIYRGDGVANNEGGTNVDGSAPSDAMNVMVFLELNDGCEVFRSTGSTSQEIATTGPVDIQAVKVADVDFADSGSFSRASDVGVNAEQAMDALVGACISGASASVTSSSRFTGYANITVNGAEDADSVNGSYLRGEGGSQDCFGWSASLLGFQGLASGDDLGVSATELAGSQGHTSVVVQAGWVGLWAINLDTMADTGGGSGVVVSDVVASVASSAVTGAIGDPQLVSGATASAAASAVPGVVLAAKVISGAMAAAASSAITGAVGDPQTISDVAASVASSAVSGLVKDPQLVAGSVAAAAASAVPGVVLAAKTISGVVASVASSAVVGSVLDPQTISAVVAAVAASAITGTVSADASATVSDVVSSAAASAVSGAALDPQLVSGVVAAVVALAVPGTVAAAKTVSDAMAAAASSAITGTVVAGAAVISGAVAAAASSAITGAVALAAVTVSDVAASVASSAVVGLVLDPQLVAGQMAQVAASAVPGAVIRGPVVVSGAVGSAASQAVTGAILLIPGVTIIGVVATAASSALLGAVDLFAGLPIREIAQRHLEASLQSIQSVSTPMPGVGNGVGLSPVSGGSPTVSETHRYTVAVTTGGASGVAQVSVVDSTPVMVRQQWPSSATGDASLAGVVVTSGSPLALGTSGGTLAVTFTGALVVGDTWDVWVGTYQGSIGGVTRNETRRMGHQWWVSMPFPDEQPLLARETPVDKREALLLCPLVVWVRRSDSMSDLLERIIGDIRTAVLSDLTRGGFAVSTELVDNRSTALRAIRAQGWCEMTAQVRVRTSRTDVRTR